MYHLCHIIPVKTSGYIQKGDIAGVVADVMKGTGNWVNMVAYILRIGFQEGERQFSPCEVPNEGEFCGKCYPAPPEHKNPCP